MMPWTPRSSVSETAASQPVMMSGDGSQLKEGQSQNSERKESSQGYETRVGAKRGIQAEPQTQRLTDRPIDAPTGAKTQTHRHTDLEIDGCLIIGEELFKMVLIHEKGHVPACQVEGEDVTIDRMAPLQKGYRWALSKLNSTAL